MIPAKRLAEIREDCAEANTPYRSSAVVPILELLELVTAYEAAREYALACDGRTHDTLMALFPPHKGDSHD